MCLRHKGAVTRTYLEKIPEALEMGIYVACFEEQQRVDMTEVDEQGEE